MPLDRFDEILPSPLSIMERRFSSDIVRFDVAEPGFPPPEAAVKATIEAIECGTYGYSSSWGITELRQAIAEFLFSTRKIERTADEILVTTGGKFANYAFFASLVKPGESVILIKPCWTSFLAVPQMLGIRTIEIWSKPPYHLNEEEIKEALRSRPRAIVLNSPNNPTGGILDERDISFVKDLAEDHDMLVLSDEIDWAYVYVNRKFISPASLDGLRERTIVTDGFSKVFCMTGWRVGFAAGPKPLLSRMHTVQEHAVSAPSTFAQCGCISALKGWREYIQRNLAVCKSNLAKLLRSLNSAGVVSCPEPEGGFYVYPKIGSGFSSSRDFSEALLKKAGVAVIPGEYFGDNRGHFRLCYAVQSSVLEEGLRRLHRFFESVR
ncbi:MAG: aminotransferase class I/II-fold pyridoxal phosphate-dependent enzyme [Candidatus Verstraetearchaeota archaeon]|nr:aminotransferase class I/II-fold pyridoxal phosphate-dependent enzyme [Candidatus Verstraetearchaeota archaeon]